MADANVSIRDHPRVAGRVPDVTPALIIIGNGPNFMVKAIAEEAGVKMPSFFGYVKYFIGILLPLFVVVTLVFFRP
jgi:Na+/H+ antiporter NhaD/arsenite permease-like protein